MITVVSLKLEITLSIIITETNDNVFAYCPIFNIGTSAWKTQKGAIESIKELIQEYVTAFEVDYFRGKRL